MSKNLVDEMRELMDLINGKKPEKKSNILKEFHIKEFYFKDEKKKPKPKDDKDKTNEVCDECDDTGITEEGGECPHCNCDSE